VFDTINIRRDTPEQARRRVNAIYSAVHYEGKAEFSNSQNANMQKCPPQSRRPQAAGDPKEGSGVGSSAKASTSTHT